MTVGIIGLGLIGGSLAKAFATRTSHRLLGQDLDESVCRAALAAGALHGRLEPDATATCDLLLLALPPQATLDVLRSVAPRVAPRTIVIDCCGVKRSVCRLGEALSEQYGFTFIGGHPMAGRECTGFASAVPTLFDQASLLLVPGPRVSEAQRSLVESLFLSLGFGQVIFTTAEHHDRMIALTSQLAHVVSNAYVKSPRAAEHRGYSAGSFADLTRVARLDEDLWSELFLENRDFLLEELDGLLASLQTYRLALVQGDGDQLRHLLKAGRECKEAL